MSPLTCSTPVVVGDNLTSIYSLQCNKFCFLWPISRWNRKLRILKKGNMLSSRIRATAARSVIRNFIRPSSAATVTKEQPQRVEKTINSVQILGRVGADPQMKGTDDHPMVMFSVATHSNYKYQSGEFLQRTEWHKIVCFKPGLRETILNYLKKGQRVYVTGRILYGEVQGDEGKSRTTMSIAADDVIFFQNNQ